MKGKKVCYVHGGPTPSGIASPQFKDGRYSKYMPQRLLERYGQALQDPDLLSLSEEVAALDARIADVMVRVDTGEAGIIWKQAQDVYNAFERAMMTEDKAESNIQFNKLGNVLGRGRADYAAWNELTGLFEKRRRLVESERKRRVEEQLTMTLEEAMSFFTAMTVAVRMNVNDRKILSAIQNEFNRLVTNTEANQLIVDG